jgi:hypothetical protein
MVENGLPRLQGSPRGIDHRFGLVAVRRTVGRGSQQMRKSEEYRGMKRVFAEHVYCRLHFARS